MRLYSHSMEYSLAFGKGKKIPPDFHDATVVTLFKNKDSKADCGNHRGIFLLSIAGKILARIMLHRLIPSVAGKNLPVIQVQ